MKKIHFLILKIRFPPHYVCDIHWAQIPNDPKEMNILYPACIKEVNYYYRKEEASLSLRNLSYTILIEGKLKSPVVFIN